MLNVHVDSFIKLNGEVVKMKGADLPELVGKSHSGDVTVEGTSFGFIVVKDAMEAKCIN